jgi:hypothetical protein
MSVEKKYRNCSSCAKRCLRCVGIYRSASSALDFAGFAQRVQSAARASSCFVDIAAETPDPTSKLFGHIVENTASVDAVDFEKQA